MGVNIHPAPAKQSRSQLQQTLSEGRLYRSTFDMGQGPHQDPRLLIFGPGPVFGESALRNWVRTPVGARGFLASAGLGREHNRVLAV